MAGTKAGRLLGLQAASELEAFHFNEGGLRELLTGPVLRDMARRGILVANAAKGFATGRGEGPHVRTGRLRNSITWWPGLDAISPYVDVGTSVFYAPFVEFGHNNTAHAFPIVTPGGTFTGAVGFVSDRPTRAYPFLRPALEAARA